MIVIKMGGDIFEKGMNESLSNDIKRILEHEKIVLVHGGGDEVTRTAEKLGKKQVFVTSPGGIKSRYTDEETVQIYTMVMAGKINKAIVRWLLSKGIPAVGLSGLDAGILRAERKKHLLILDERNRKRIIEGGYTGKIHQVNICLLEILVTNGYVPVVAPAAVGSDYELLNVDSDRAAGQIARALNAEKLVLLTDVKGIELHGRYLDRLSLTEAEELLPKMGPGMDKKVLASIEAVRAGVREAIISSGLINEPVCNAMNHSAGTVITP